MLLQLITERQCYVTGINQLVSQFLNYASAIFDTKMIFSASNSFKWIYRSPSLVTASLVLSARVSADYYNGRLFCNKRINFFLFIALYGISVSSCLFCMGFLTAFVEATTICC